MAEEKSQQEQLDQIIQRLNYLESVLRDSVTRLYAIEQRLGPGQRVAEPTPRPKPAAPSRAETGAPPAIHPTATQPPAAPPPTTPGPSAARRVNVKSRADLEARIGGNWFNRIGIIAISFGVAFFLKYAFENEWIGPAGRVGIGVVIGLGFLIAGERMRARYASYAHGLSGGGILILYISVYAAFAFYQLIPHLPAFLMMALVTMTAAVLAARYAALPIAVLGLIGGFLTPFLLSRGVDNQAGLFGYIALLNAGVLALAYSKQWRSLNYMAFVATVLVFAAWMIVWYDESKLWPTVFFLTLFFAIFALLAILYNVVNHRLVRWADLSLVFANAFLYFATSYSLLEYKYRSYLGLFALMVSAFYLGLGAFTYKRDREDRLLVYTFLGLAFVFLVLAVPIQFDQHWVTMAWAVEGAVMTWIGLRVGDRTSRYGALLVFLIAASHWLVIDAHDFAYQANLSFVPLLNSRALSCAVLIGGLAAAAWLYKHLGEGVNSEERAMFGAIYVLGANALAVTLLSLEANDYFEQKEAQASRARADHSVYMNPLENSKQLTLTMLWTVYGAMTLAVGITRRLKPLRLAALVLLAMATLKVLVVDLQYYDVAWHRPLLNQTFAAFVVLIMVLAAAAWFYSRAEAAAPEERSIVVPVVVVAANVLAIIALSAEASGYFSKQLTGLEVAGAEWRDLRLAQELSLSVIWMVYGGALLIFGINRRNALLRIMALLLLSLTIIKVFFVDLASLERLYRIISFIVLGAILLAVSFLYQRLRQRAAEEDAAAADAPPGVE